VGDSCRPLRDLANRSGSTTGWRFCCQDLCGGRDRVRTCDLFRVSKPPGNRCAGSWPSVLYPCEPVNKHRSSAFVLGSKGVVGAGGAESALTVLHRLPVRFPVPTGAGCCPSAAHLKPCLHRSTEGSQCAMSARMVDLKSFPRSPLLGLTLGNPAEELASPLRREEAPRLPRCAAERTHGAIEHS
jgi:hypothetical protein